MLKSRSKEDRRIFRESLVSTILYGPVLELSSAEQMQFIDLLSQSWIVIPDAPDSDRIRSLKKVASDSRRLKQALSSQEKFTVNSVPKPFIKDRISSSSAAPFMATKRRQKYLACFQTISMRLSSGL